MTLGNRLKSLRKNLEKTQAEIIALLKTYNVSVNRVTVSRWENDEQQPTLAPIMALAQIYGVSSDYLIDGTITNKDLPVICKELIVNCTKMNDEGMRMMYEYSEYVLSRNDCLKNNQDKQGEKNTA